jgi:cytochrome c-type biogenesis protein CcmH/NrfG
VPLWEKVGAWTLAVCFILVALFGLILVAFNVRWTGHGMVALIVVLCLATGNAASLARVGQHQQRMARERRRQAQSSDDAS